MSKAAAKILKVSPVVTIEAISNLGAHIGQEECQLQALDDLGRTRIESSHVILHETSQEYWGLRRRLNAGDRRW